MLNKENNKIIYICNFETIGLPEQYKEKTNILLELSLIEIKNQKINMISNKNKNEEEISIEAMSIHNITPQIVEKEKKFHLTNAYKTLYKASLENKNNIFLIVNEIDFAKKVLINANIDLEKFNIIDIKQVLGHLFKSDFKFEIDENIPSLKLNFLRYYFKNINENINQLIKNQKIKSPSNSLIKTCIIYELLNYIINKYDLSLETMKKISTEYIEIKYLIINKKNKRIKEVEDYQLISFLKYTSDKNIINSITIELKRRGIELDKTLLTVGKYKGEYIENIEDIQYLEWIYKNMTHLDETLLENIKNKINNLKLNNDKKEKNYEILIKESENQIIIEGILPSNIREWLEQQVFISVKYNECILINNEKTKKRNEKILDRIVKNEKIKILKIKVKND